MPNHVTNCFTISGRKTEIQKIIMTAGIQAPNGDFNPHEFDFNGFIPMPEALADSQAGYNSGMNILLAHADIHPHLLKDKMNAFENFGHIAKKLDISGLSADELNDLVKDGYAEKPLRDYLEFVKNDPKKSFYFERAKAALHNEALYGYADWYEWAWAKWGTKWNAYEVTATLQIGSQADMEIDRKALDAIDKDAEVSLQIRFDTAWSMPGPIFDHIVKHYQVELQGESVEDSAGFACEYSTKSRDGVPFLDVYTYEDFDIVQQFYYSIFGYTPFEDEDEDEELDAL